jgi:hypothetical protein
MQIGIDSFVAIYPDPVTGVALSAPTRLRNLLEEIELADQVGLDIFGVGEHSKAVKSPSGTSGRVLRLSPFVPPFQLR